MPRWYRILQHTVTGYCGAWKGIVAMLRHPYQH